MRAGKFSWVVFDFDIREKNKKCFDWLKLFNLRSAAFFFSSHYVSGHILSYLKGKARLYTDLLMPLHPISFFEKFIERSYILSSIYKILIREEEKIKA